MLVFFNDIMIYSKTWKAHLKHLQVVFQTLQQHQLIAKISKCCFAVKHIDYLGHTINKNGV